MSWFDDVLNIVVGVVQKAIDIHRDAFTAVLDALAQVGHDLATFSDYFRTGLEKLYANVVPEDVARWITLNWYLLETATQYGASFIANFSAALKTGRLGEIFDLIKPAAATAMRNARREAVPSAQPLPPSIISLIPDANDRGYLADCRYTTYDQIDDKRFVEAWSFFTGRFRPADAITLIDVILFKRPPDLLKPADIFTFVHEVKHLLQFRDKGVDSIVSDYLDDVASKRPIPVLEEDADLFACSLVPGQTPHYIGACP